jgi:hypothetical protein
VVSGTRTALAAQATLVLQDMVSELVRQDVAEHEATKRVAWPGHDTFLGEIRARRQELRSLRTRQCKSKPPRRRRLVVEDDSPRPEQLCQGQPLAGVWGGD